MSWIGAAWSDRIAVVVDGTVDGTSDIQVVIPSTLTRFWSRALSTGYDVRFTVGDGAVALGNMKRTTWVYASSTATFELGAVPTKAGSTVLWLYWGNSAAPDTATTPTIASPKSGNIDVSRPTGPNIVRVGLERHGATLPRSKIRKASAEELRIWWDFRGVLEAASSPVQGALLYEEPSAISLVQVQNSSEEAQAGMVDSTKTRVHGHWVSTWVKSGTSGQSYIAICRVLTSNNRVLEGRAHLEVKNLEL